MKAYPIGKVIGVIEYVQNERVSNYLLSELDLSKKNKKLLSEEFKRFYNHNYEILESQGFYISILDKAYTILLEIIKLDGVRTFSANSLKIQRFEAFKVLTNILYSADLFKETPRWFITGGFCLFNNQINNFSRNINFFYKIFSF